MKVRIVSADTGEIGTMTSSSTAFLTYTGDASRVVRYADFYRAQMESDATGDAVLRHLLSRMSGGTRVWAEEVK